MNPNRDFPPTPTARIFFGQWAARFGNIPELAEPVLAKFAESTDPDLWIPLLDYASASGYSQQKKPLLAELNRAKGAIITDRLAVKAARAPISRPANAATAAEVDVILSGAALGGPRLSAWLVTCDSDATKATRPNTWPLGVLTNAPAGALEVVGAAHRINDAWAKWATAELEAGQEPEALAEQIAAKAPAAATESAPGKTDTVVAVATALREAAETSSARTIDPLREAME